MLEDDSFENLSTSIFQKKYFINDKDVFFLLSKGPKIQSLRLKGKNHENLLFLSFCTGGINLIQRRKKVSKYLLM